MQNVCGRTEHYPLNLCPTPPESLRSVPSCNVGNEVIDGGLIALYISFLYIISKMQTTAEGSPDNVLHGPNHQKISLG